MNKINEISNTLADLNHKSIFLRVSKAYEELLKENRRLNSQVAKYKQALEFISDIYDHEASVVQNSMAAYEAQNMARSALRED